VKAAIKIWSIGEHLMDGQATVKQASAEMGKRVEDTLKKAGYYDGKKPLAQ
jgi:multiple sugar transport system substrate-binding protein